MVFLAPQRVPAAPPVFAQETSDLKPDPAAHWGRLPNGVRYVVLSNREPRARASLRLVVGSGSLYETETQRGLAHFLEHMAFNGSTHYAPGTLVEYLQRLGMSFGADTNAQTSFDDTIYLLELPDTQPHSLTDGLPTTPAALCSNPNSSRRNAASSWRKNGLATRSTTAPGWPSMNSSSPIP